MGGGGRWYPTPEPKRREPEPYREPEAQPLPLPTPKDALALHQYNDLRFTCHELEELIASVEGEEGWTEKDLKRLDKAVTVMKVGFKIFKKVLKTRARRRVLEHANR
jgi:hypothetical protein